MGKNEFRLGRPNIVTIFLWITAIAILIMTGYVRAREKSEIFNFLNIHARVLHLTTRGKMRI